MTRAPRFFAERIIQGLFNPGEIIVFWRLIVKLGSKVKGRGRT